MKFDLKPFKNKRVAAAVSGGMDSMALLYYLKQNKEKYNITLMVVNIEHGIRGIDSVNDSEFVEAHCQKLDIEFIGYKVSAPKFSKASKIGLEAAARKLRYDCFFDALKTHELDFIATAHHMSDNAESVLFNLLRGTGLKGVGGISENYNSIIRPMLKVSRAQIETFIKSNNIEYVVDKTNSDQTYSRNYIRCSIMPPIKRAFPNAEKALCAFAKAAADDDELLQGLSEKLLKTQRNSIKIAKTDQKPLFMRAVIKALNILGQGRDYSSKQLLSVYALLQKPSGKEISLNGGVRAVNEFGEIVLYREKQPVTFAPVSFKIGRLKIGDKLVEISPLIIPKSAFLKDKKRQGLIFDIDDIPNGALFRTRREGDTFKSFCGKNKSLKKYLIEKKVPKRQRDSLIVLANGNKILLIVGLEISDEIKVTEKSINIYKIAANI